VKPEFAHLYPRTPRRVVAVGRAISETIAQRLVRQHGYVGLGKKCVLPDVHFEFRGELPKGVQLPGQRRRLADRLG
jgi:hypothetical protein